jgi:DNA helicase-2/ATP-dependent DNA helicase PcrA
MPTTSPDKFQKSFCVASGGRHRLLAPAGSGKTSSILWRCLEQSGVTGASSKSEKARFLVFTFTRAARDELRDRVRQDSAFASIRDNIEIMTLNAWGYRRIKARLHQPRLITSGADFYSVVHNVLQPVWKKHPRVEAALTTSRAKGRAAKVIVEVMDTLKSLGFRHDKHATEAAFQQHVKTLANMGLAAHWGTVPQRLADIEVLDPAQPITLSAVYAAFFPFWAQAVEQMFQIASITLEDQKYWTLIELEQAVRERRFTTGMHRFHHVIVDEFQDINLLDLNLLRTIAELNKADLTIVGDDDQAIYEWRGASPLFITDPNTHIQSGYQTHILENNYRSPRNVVQLAQRLIQNNTRRVAKNVQPISKVDAKIEVLSTANLTQTIDFVLQRVKHLLKAKDIARVAIIGRKRSQIIPYQIAFARENIPFYAAEDLQVFLSDAFGSLKEMLAIRARATAGPIPGLDPAKDAMTLCDRVKRFPLNKQDREALRRHLATSRPRSLAAAADAIRSYGGTLKGTNQGGRMSTDFADAIQAFLAARTVSDAINSIGVDFAGLQRDYGRGIEDIFYADPPFFYLAEYAQRYGNDYMAFMDDLEKAETTLAKIPPEDVEGEADPAWKLPLHLMTALRAKGKEFDVVILLDVNDDIWPSALAQTPEQREQERRVFYVAFTRARKAITILVNRALLNRAVLPSPYLAEMGLTPTSLNP